MDSDRVSVHTALGVQSRTWSQNAYSQRLCATLDQTARKLIFISSTEAMWIRKQNLGKYVFVAMKNKRHKSELQQIQLHWEQNSAPQRLNLCKTGPESDSELILTAECCMRFPQSVIFNFDSLPAAHVTELLAQSLPNMLRESHSFTFYALGILPSTFLKNTDMF